MADHIVAVDAGNGGTNAVMAKLGGGYKAFYEPSIRSMVYGESWEGMDQHVIQADYIEWNGFRYVTGDDALTFNRATLERHLGSNRYANEFQQFLIASALARLGVKEGTVDLTLFVPPGMFKEVKPVIIQRFTENKGEVTVRLKNDKKPRTWRYEQVTVLPEAVAGAFCFVADDKGEPYVTRALDGDVLVLDIGAHTVDAVKIINGKFNLETLSHATWEREGIHIHVREPIMQALRNKSDEFAVRTVDDIDRVIRTGSVSGDYTLTSGAVTVDLEALLRKYSERYAEQIANLVIDGAFNALQGIRALILVGGGATLIEPYLHKWYGDKMLDRTKFPTTRKLHPVDMNAVGGLRLALMRLKSKQKV